MAKIFEKTRQDSFLVHFLTSIKGSFDLKNCKKVTLSPLDDPPPPKRVKTGHLSSLDIELIQKSISERYEHFPLRSNSYLWWLKLEIHPKKSHENFEFAESPLFSSDKTNSFIGNFFSSIQNCIYLPYHSCISNIFKF